MAEPEGLEEDLFADLYALTSYQYGNCFCLTPFLHSYDADDSTNRTTSAVEAPRPTDVTDSAIPAQSIEDAPAQIYDNSAAESYSTQVAPQPDFTGYQNGYGAASATTAPPPADNEPQGTGIKEDG